MYRNLAGSFSCVCQHGFVTDPNDDTKVSIYYLSVHMNMYLYVFNYLSMSLSTHSQIFLIFSKCICNIFIIFIIFILIIYVCINTVYPCKQCPQWRGYLPPSGCPSRRQACLQWTRNGGCPGGDTVYPNLQEGLHQTRQFTEVFFEID